MKQQNKAALEKELEVLRTDWAIHTGSYKEHLNYGNELNEISPWAWEEYIQGAKVILQETLTPTIHRIRTLEETLNVESTKRIKTDIIDVILMGL